MKFKTGVFLMFFWLASLQCYPQNSRIDSISHLLSRQATDDSLKVDLLLKKAILFQRVSEDSVYAYANKGAALAHQLGYVDGQATGLALIGDYFLRVHQIEQSENAMLEALTLFKTTNDTSGIMTCLRRLGDINRHLFQYEKAFQYYENLVSLCVGEAHVERRLNTLGIIANLNQRQEKYEVAKESFSQILEMAMQAGSHVAMIKSYSSLGQINSELGRYSETLQQYSEALQIAEKHEATRYIPVLLHNIGTVYLKQKQYEKSLDYLHQAYALYEENHDDNNMLNSLNDIGSIYQEMDSLHRALEYYEDALQIAEERKAAGITTPLLNNTGHLYIKLANYPESISYLYRGLEMATVTRSRSKILYAYLGLGKVHFKTRQYEKALSFAWKSLTLLEETGNIEHRNEVHELLANIYAATGRYQQAYEQQILFQRYTDSVMNLETTRKIISLEMEYQYKEEQLSAQLKEEQLILENEKTRERLASVTNQKLWLVIGIMALILVLLFIFMNNNVRSLQLKTRNVLTEQKLLRSQMTPHFMFNSLSVLQGIILNKEYDKSIRYLSKFSGLLRLSLENSMQTMVPLSKELAAIEQYMIVQNIARRVPFQYQICVPEQVDSQVLLIPPMLVQPFVENAIKHGFCELCEHQKIEIALRSDHHCLTCQITDNGMGVHMHQQKSDRQTTSISTNLIRERLTLLGREFNIDLGIIISDRGDGHQTGTQVTIRLPYKTQTDDESTIG